MGEPNDLKSHYHDVGRTQGTETSKYLQEEKTTVIPQVVASERGDSPNRGRHGVPGVVGLQCRL